MTENRKAKILIIDDHPIVREGMARLINEEPEFHVCCKAGSLVEAEAMCKTCPHDLAIVDMSIEGMSGLAIVKKFQALYPKMFLLVISMHDERIYAEPSIQAGAHGYLMKQEATDTMIYAIKRVLSGDLYLSDQIRSKMLNRFRSGNSEGLSIDDLTHSEFEILQMIGMAMSTAEIATKLNRSIKTIESHRSNIKRKLALKSGLELTQFAIKMAAT